MKRAEKLKKAFEIVSNLLHKGEIPPEQIEETQRALRLVEGTEIGFDEEVREAEEHLLSVFQLPPHMRTWQKRPRRRKYPADY